MWQKVADFSLLSLLCFLGHQTTANTAHSAHAGIAFSPMLSPTDLTRWHLKVEEGRQTWSFTPEDADNPPQSVHERYFLGLPIPEEEVPDLPEPSNLAQVATNAVDFYQRLLTEDGHWANDYGGPMFLMPGLIITCFITNTDLGAPRRAEMIRYLRNQQREDGGWGLHIESPSTIFGSALSYASLRILGLDADDETVVKARQFLKNNGGAEGIPSWGKFWLAVLGCYEWEGLNPIPPEFWLLPYAVPVHPGRWWCHCRMVYLPMGYLYARRAKGPITPLIRDLRREMFSADYDTIVWDNMRNHVSSLDMYTPHSALVNTVHCLATLGPFWPTLVGRRWCLAAHNKHRPRDGIRSLSLEDHEGKVASVWCLLETGLAFVQVGRFGGRVLGQGQRTEREGTRPSVLCRAGGGRREEGSGFSCKAESQSSTFQGLCRPWQNSCKGTGAGKRGRRAQKGRPKKAEERPTQSRHTG